MAFVEVQRFRQVWLWLLILGLNAIFIYILYTNFIVLKEIETIAYGILAIYIIFPLPLTLLFLFIKLESEYTEESLKFRWWPLDRSFYEYKWSELQKIEMKEIRSFSGGIRYSPTLGYIHRVKGKHGIFIVPFHGEGIFVGTQQPDQVLSVLKDKIAN